jgi:hypothetical protein
MGFESLPGKTLKIRRNKMTGSGLIILSKKEVTMSTFQIFKRFTSISVSK